MTHFTFFSSKHSQQGAVVVEFALVGLIFFSILFAIIEVGRALFLWNTVQEITRRAARAAAIANFQDADALDAIHADAIFNPSSEKLLLGGAIDKSYVRIDYLWLSSAGVMAAVPTLPDSPTQNIINCITTPNANNCIRYVSAQLCKPGTNCDAVEYVPMIPLMALIFPSGGVYLPTGKTVVAAEALGHR